MKGGNIRPYSPFSEICQWPVSLTKMLASFIVRESKHKTG